MKLLFRALKIPKIFDKNSDLISNIAINKLLSPVYFSFVFYYLHYIKNIPVFGKSAFLGSAPLSLFSTSFYIWCSYFFQPDLDVRRMRPGINTFPFGSTIMNSPIGLLLLPIQKLMAKLWYYMWHPFALTFTHRGVTHWPIISTYLRIFYLKGILMVLFYITSPIFGEVTPLKILDFYLDMFFPSNKYFFSPIWMIICFPVFIVDIFHEIIDFIDSKRKGLSYCPPQIQRGFLASTYSTLKKIIKSKT